MQQGGGVQLGLQQPTVVQTKPWATFGKGLVNFSDCGFFKAKRKKERLGNLPLHYPCFLEKSSVRLCATLVVKHRYMFALAM